MRATTASDRETTALIRYGLVPEVARFASALEDLRRGERVVVQSHRGLQLGTFLNFTKPAEDVEPAAEVRVLRRASAEDQSRVDEQRRHSEGAFAEWCERIEQWGLDLQLIDLEWTLDQAKLILYVLNERGPDCTRLALQAAAAGLGLVEVQPVDADGLVQQPSGGGGCGSGGGGCGCS